MKTRVVPVNNNAPGAVYIGRRNRWRRLPESQWANPCRIGKDGSRRLVIALYRRHLRDRIRHDLEAVAELHSLVGKPLACWCRHDGEERTEDNGCHGDVLVEVIQELGLEGEYQQD